MIAESADALARLSYAWEVRSAPEASPTAGPTWLRACDGTGPHLPPCRYLVSSRGPRELAMLPTYIVHAPSTPDADPRSYFGGAPQSAAQHVCCGSQQPSPTIETLATLRADQVFPAMVLGSLPGYKTEIIHSYWTPELAAQLLDAAIGYAGEHQIATIVAPWVADRGSSKVLAHELSRRGAVASFWAVEDYLPLGHRSLQEHLAAGRKADRHRYRRDMRAAEASGLSVRPLSAGELRRNLERIGVLIAATQHRYGEDDTGADLARVLGRLLELGVPLLCTGGFRNGRLVACCMSIEKADRVYAKYAGFDYDAIGTRSSAYFAVAMYGPLAAACGRRARVVEFGVGAHQAKARRGCLPRTVSSYLLAAQPSVRDVFAAASAISTRQRRAEFTGR